MNKFLTLIFISLFLIISGCATFGTYPTQKIKFDQSNVNDCSFARYFSIDKSRKSLECSIEITVPKPEEYAISILLPKDVATNIKSDYIGRTYFQEYDLSNEDRVKNVQKDAVKNQLSLLVAYTERLLDKSEKYCFERIRYTTFITQILQNDKPNLTFSIDVKYSGTDYLKVLGFLQEFPPILLIPKGELNTGLGEINLADTSKKAKAKYIKEQIAYLENKGYDINKLLTQNKTVIVQISDKKCMDDLTLLNLTKEHSWIYPLFLFVNDSDEPAQIFLADKLPYFSVIYLKDNETKSFSFSFDCGTLDKKQGLDEIILKNILSGKE